MVEDGVRREDRSQEGVISGDREGNGGGNYMVRRIGDLKLDTIGTLTANEGARDYACRAVQRHPLGELSIRRGIGN